MWMPKSIVQTKEAARAKALRQEQVGLPKADQRDQEQETHRKQYRG